MTNNFTVVNKMTVRLYVKSFNVEANNSIIDDLDSSIKTCDYIVPALVALLVTVVNNCNDLHYFTGELVTIVTS